MNDDIMSRLTPPSQEEVVQEKARISKLRRQAAKKGGRSRWKGYVIGKTVTVRCRPYVFDALKDLSEQEGRPVSLIVEDAVRLYVQSGGAATSQGTAENCSDKKD